MSPIRPPTRDDASLHALVDGRLPPAQAQRERDALDEAARRQLAAWEHQRALLQAFHRDGIGRPQPDPLLRAADRLQQTQAAQRRWAAWGGMAASWGLAFGLGWALHVRDDSARLATTILPSPVGFARQAALAHAVFQPEQRHPVEVTAAEQDHLVQWLSRRLARPLAVPQLREQGFELMGGRLLPGGGGQSPPSATAPAGPPPSGVRAQFMYQNTRGVRITLYLGALENPQPAQAMAFQFRSEGALSSFYWIEHDFGYALSGELPRPVLLALATAVHRQLSAAPPSGGKVPPPGS